jgi:hypothetical protein
MKFAKTCLLVFVLISPACSTPGLRAETDLLEVWSTEAQSLVPEPPYVARYQRNGKHLSYLASRHEHHNGNAVFELVSIEFEALRPQVVIIEGLNRAAGLSPQSYADWVSQMVGQKMWPAGEAGYSAWLAGENSIDFVGGEPSPQEILRAIDDSPYTLRDLIYYFTLRQIPQWKRTDLDPEHNFGALYADFISQQSHAYGIKVDDFTAPNDFITWYEMRNQKPFDIGQITVMDAAPITGSDALYTNQISVFEDVIRNTRITQVIAEMLNLYDRVLVVYGAGHHVQQAKVLDRMMGTPSFPAAIL